MEKPILFNTEMVKAILEGRKTVTRRVIKKKYENTDIQWFENKHGKRLVEMQNDAKERINADGTKSMQLRACAEIKPPYQVGDILWVKETWCELCHVDENYVTHYDQTQYYYKTDGDYQIDLYDDDGHYLDEQKMKWHPSIHMPKEAARIFLKVTDVRVERLQDINEEQAIKEGIRYFDEFAGGYHWQVNKETFAYPEVLCILDFPTGGDEHRLYKISQLCSQFNAFVDEISIKAEDMLKRSLVRNTK